MDLTYIFSYMKISNLPRDPRNIGPRPAAAAHLTPLRLCQRTPCGRVFGPLAGFSVPTPRGVATGPKSSSIFRSSLSRGHGCFRSRLAVRSQPGVRRPVPPAVSVYCASGGRGAGCPSDRFVGRFLVTVTSYLLVCLPVSGFRRRTGPTVLTSDKVGC